MWPMSAHGSRAGRTAFCSHLPTGRALLRDAVDRSHVERLLALGESLADRGGDSAVADPAGWPMNAAMKRASRPLRKRGPVRLGVGTMSSPRRSAWGVAP